MAPARRCLLAGLAASLLACAPAAGRYVVNTTPVQIGLGNLGLCFAVDPGDPHGLWWWEPGASGCTTRSTGPDLFHPDDAKVSQPRPGVTEIELRLGTHDLQKPFIRVRLILDDAGLRSLETGSRSDVERRDDLTIPEQAPRLHRPG